MGVWRFSISLCGASHLGSGGYVASQALGKNWYEPLLTQRHICLLGRSVDLTKLLTQRLNKLQRQSIDVAIARCALALRLNDPIYAMKCAGQSQGALPFACYRHCFA